MYTTHAAFGFMLLAVAYFVSFQTVTGDRPMHLHLAHTGSGNAQRKQQTRQQAVPCDAGISHHHTAAAAAALTRPGQACAAANRPNALRCPWTHRQTQWRI